MVLSTMLILNTPKPPSELSGAWRQWVYEVAVKLLTSAVAAPSFALPMVIAALPLFAYFYSNLMA